MRSGLFISLFVSVLTICGINATAQEPPVLPEEIADTDKLESSAALPEYVIEVRRPEGCLVSPISSKGKSGFVLYTLPRPDKYTSRGGEDNPTKRGQTAIRKSHSVCFARIVASHCSARSIQARA